MDIQLSVREQIIEAFVKLVKGMADPTGNTNSLFNRVLRGNTDDVTPDMLPCCGIDEGRERSMGDFNLISEKSVLVYFEFKWAKENGDLDPYKRFNYYAPLLEQLILADVHLGGLTMAIYPIETIPQVEGRRDPLPSGCFIADVRFRHMFGNPYQNV